jgi:hypothetical protein
LRRRVVAGIRSEDLASTAIAVILPAPGRALKKRL